MSRRILTSAVLAAAFLAAGCGGGGSSRHQQQEEGVVGVGVIGSVVSVDLATRRLVIEETALDYQPQGAAEASQVTEALAVGARGQRLEVFLPRSGKVNLGGDTGTLADVQVGQVIVVLGFMSGTTLVADGISDLQGLGVAPEPGASAGLAREGDPASVVSALAGATSLCLGQEADTSDPAQLDFQGCWGGPSATDEFTPNVFLLGGKFLGLMLHRYYYSASLGGWSFDFPFEFAVQGSPTYHAPSDVTLQVIPRAPIDGSYSFAGGLGFEFGLDFDVWGWWHRYHLYTFSLSAFSTVHRSQNPGPLEGHMEIDEAACPMVGLLSIPKVPIDPVEVGLCEDLGLNGRPFHATVAPTQGAVAWTEPGVAFQNAGATRSIEATSSSVDVTFSDFEWTPEMTMGVYLRVQLLGLFTWDSPSVSFGEIGAFHAIPLGPEFSVPTDPLSPIDALRYLTQPTEVTVSVQVAPAPTSLTFVSPGELAAGSPVAVLLAEAHDGTPIPGQTIAFVARDLACSAEPPPDRPAPVAFRANCLPPPPSCNEDVSGTAVTDEQGVAVLPLPAGSWDVVATFAGEGLYLGSSAEQVPVKVYGSNAN